MKLIKLEQVDYGYDCSVTPTKDDIYINEEYLMYLEKRAKNTNVHASGFVYIVHLKGGCEIHISEECFNRILRSYDTSGEIVKFPPLPEAKPTKPETI